jgi:alginate O-acetyltransferase complex protein AlgI
LLFNSFEFIFLFLPAALFGFFVLGRLGRYRLAIYWLCLASLFFYAWWNPVYLLLLVPFTFANYGLGYLIGTDYFHARPRARRALLFLGVAADLGTLGYFKYTNFFLEWVNRLFETAIPPRSIILPLGISFYTFQMIAYLVDCYRRECQEKDPIKFLFFPSFFPHQIAGPIVHHQELLPQTRNPSLFRPDAELIAKGITIFAIGLFKKVVFSDAVAVYSTSIFSSLTTGYIPNLLEAWIGALSYSLQIYFDFSGYSDMAIGAALLFGLRLPINFLSPYQSRSIIDFWRRWHISLSRFLREYLYFPLGGNRNGRFRKYLNLFLTMAIGGLWHGANTTFVIWGALHGIYLMINHGFRALKLGFIRAESLWWKSFSHGLTYLGVVFAWVFFRADSTRHALTLIESMLGMNAISLPAGMLNRLPGLGGGRVNFHGVTELGAGTVLFWIALLHAIAFFAPNTASIAGYDPGLDVDPGAEKEMAAVNKRIKSGRFIRWKPTFAWALVLGIATFYAILRIAQPSEFLYFQF